MEGQPAPGELLLRSPLFSHVISPAVRLQVCDHCLARPAIWDHLQPATLSRCAKCKLPYYCGSACQRAAWKLGHKVECKYLTSVAPRVPPPFVLLLLRTLQRATINPAYKETLPYGSRGLTDLWAHEKKIEKSAERREAFLAYLPVVAACVGDKYTQADLWINYCRLLINSTELTDGMGNSIGTALSLGLSALDHSCAPNCNVAFVGASVEVRSLPSEGRVTWKNARISYLSEVLPTSERCKRLEKQYYFDCQCSKCCEEGEELVAGAAVCQKCRSPVAVSKEKCKCGEDVPGEARIAGAFISQGEDENLTKWRRLSKLFHPLDWRMVELGETAMADALEAAKFKVFLEIGTTLLEKSYRTHLHPYSLSLGLHLAKLAKAAIFLEQEQVGLDLLKEALNIFSLALGEDSALVTYCRALRNTI